MVAQLGTTCRAGSVPNQGQSDTSADDSRFACVVSRDYSMTVTPIQAIRESCHRSIQGSREARTCFREIVARFFQFEPAYRDLTSGVKTMAHFMVLSQAGRALGDLHVGYENVPEYPASIEGPSNPKNATASKR